MKAFLQITLINLNYQLNALALSKLKLEGR